MPEQISVSEFIQETWEDYNSPTTSTFVNRIGQCRNAVSHLEETIDMDRSGLNKMKKSVKALYSTGNAHVSNESYLAENLQKLGHGKDNGKEISEAFLKFAVVTKELSGLMNNLMQNLTNILMFPLDNLLKGDLKGIKGDLKKPFDKASKEYEAKFSKIEKEKKQAAKDAGMIKSEVTGPEIAEEMEKERRMFQLQMCEYLLKVNEIKTKKGTDLLQHLVKYYHAQLNYFTDGLRTIEHFRCYIEELVIALGSIKQQQDSERRKLVELRDALKTNVAAYRETGAATTPGYSLHQLQGNKAHGNERTGFLLKKSDGKMRKVWQRRKCIIKDGILSISHSDVTKEPVRLNLLTCQVKLLQDDPGKKCFDLISSSKNRTYHFQADDTADMETWISVLNNAKEAVLMKAFGEATDKESSPINQSVKELTGTIIQEVKRLPGNRYCCDCSAPDPEWLSVNLGVLICLECCGVHRDMGVHISRTQSIVIDALGTSQLLQARVMGNEAFNDIMEATLDQSMKPAPASSMEERKSFIRAKYESKRYAIMTCSNMEDRKYDLKQAIMNCDLGALLQVYAEGVDFMETLPDMDKNQTALHLAVEQDDDRTLYMVDFLVQNSNSQALTRRDNDGNNCLHLCAKLNRTECMKLMLRVQPDSIHYENALGQTPLDVAKECRHEMCVDLLNHALAGKVELFQNVNVDWGLISDDHSYDDVDFSDDDIVDRCQTPDKLRSRGSRPNSLIVSSDLSLASSTSRDRAGSDHRATAPVLPEKTSTLPQQHKKPGGFYMPNTTLSGSTQSLSVHNRKAMKAPAPPPPSSSHPHVAARQSRKISDPGFNQGHRRTPSDPPPLPAKQGGNKSNLPGTRLVLPPPPPEFRSTDNLLGSRPMKPDVAPKPPSRLVTAPSSGSGNHNNHEPDARRNAIRRTGAPVIAHSYSREGYSDSSPSPPSQTPKAMTSRGQGSRDMNESRSPQGRGGGVNGQASRRTDGADSGGSLGGSQGSLSSIGELPGAPLKHGMRCRALYDCEADNEDELSFREGEIIIVLKEEEEEWWEGRVEGQPHRCGMFPTTFVEVIK